MFRTLALPMLLGLGLAIVAPAARAETSCTAMSESEVVREGGRLTTLLRIASFRADLNAMENHLSKLETFVASCPATRKILACGPSCYYEQAHVFLFKASDLPYLSSSSGRGQVARLSSTSADTLRFVNEGVRRAEEGLRIASKPQNSVAAPTDVGQDSSEAALKPPSAFKTYINNTAMLTGMLIRLKMTAGDAWYQDLSMARLQNLDALVTKATQRPAVVAAGCASGSELCAARAFYEDALWRLIEAKSDVPATEEYAPTRETLEELETDLRLRLNSIKAGRLFLDLDPERFSTIPSSELLNVLSRMQARLGELETRIEALVQNWAAEKANQQQMLIDEQRFFDGQQANLISHKIAKLDTEAQLFAQGVDKDLNQLNFDNEDWEYRRMIRLMEVDLEKKQIDTRAQKSIISNRKDSELAAIRQDRLLDQRGELRWLISAKLTQNSLEMQIGAFESQRLEYSSRLESNDLKAAQIRERINQAKLSQQIAQNEQGSATERLQQINQERTQIFETNRKAMAVAICDLETSLGFLGEKPAKPFRAANGEACTLPKAPYTKAQYQAAICDPVNGLRQKLAADRLAGSIFIRKCVTGIAAQPPGADAVTIAKHNALVCPATLPGEFKIAKDMADAEKAVRKKNQENLTAKLDTLKKYIDDFHNAYGTLDTWVANKEGALNLAEAAYVTAYSVAETEMTSLAAGMCTGIATATNPQKLAKDRAYALYTEARRFFEFGRGRAESDVIRAEKFGALMTQVKDLENSVASFNVQDSLAEAEAGRVIAQIMGKDSVQQQEILQAQLLRSTTIEDCNQSAAQLDADIGRLKAEHERQLSLYDADALRNENAQHNVNIEQLRFGSAKSEEQIQKSREADLQKDLALLTIENATIQKQDTALAKRIASTQGVMTEVERIDAQSRALNDFLAETRTDRYRLATAIEKTEQDRLDDILNKDVTSVDTERKKIFERLDNSKLSLKLKNRLNEANRDTTMTIAGLRDQLIGNIEKTIVNSRGEREKVFLVSAEQLTDMIAGIPEYTRAKKAVVGAVNTAMSHLRSRFKTLAGLAGDAPEVRKVPYIRTSAELETVMRSFCKGRGTDLNCIPEANAPFYDERQVETFAESILIPGSSGLARALVRDGEAYFRIAPLAGNSAEDMRRQMADNGYFTLWATRFSRQRNLVLTDVVVGVDYTCVTPQSDRLRLTHVGDGLLFRSLTAGSTTSVPVMMSEAPRSWALGVYDLKNGDRPDFDKRVASWKGEYQMRNFPESRQNPDGSEAPLPFLGAPLMATYKLSYQEGSCPLEGSNITLTFAYAAKGN